MSKVFFPDIMLKTVFDIDLDKLKNDGFKAIIFDIDNTLAAYCEPVANQKTAAWIDSLKLHGFKLFIVSNNDYERVQIFAENIDVPHFGKALKPLNVYLKKACRIMGVTSRETVLVGDQLFTDIWGGNAMGMKTIMVEPISDNEGGFIKFKRHFEKKLLARMK